MSCYAYGDKRFLKRPCEANTGGATSAPVTTCSKPTVCCCEEKAERTPATSSVAVVTTKSFTTGMIAYPTFGTNNRPSYRPPCGCDDDYIDPCSPCRPLPPCPGNGEIVRPANPYPEKPPCGCHDGPVRPLRPCPPKPPWASQPPCPCSGH
jgi:hypothetical protein